MQQGLLYGYQPIEVITFAGCLLTVRMLTMKNESPVPSALINFFDDRLLSKDVIYPICGRSHLGSG